MNPPIGAIDHVAVVVRSLDEALPRYEALFGLRPDAPPRDFAPQRVRLAFLATGPDPAARIELIEPLDGDSGVARVLARHGEGRHHLAAAEAELIDREPRAGAHGDVAFVHPRTLNGVLWELLGGLPGDAGVAQQGGDLRR